MAEWLRRLIRNQLGLSHAGSSPVTVVNVVVDCSCFTIFHFLHLGKTWILVCIHGISAVPIKPFSFSFLAQPIVLIKKQGPGVNKTMIAA